MRHRTTAVRQEPKAQSSDSDTGDIRHCRPCASNHRIALCRVPPDYVAVVCRVPLGAMGDYALRLVFVGSRIPSYCRSATMYTHKTANTGGGHMLSLDISRSGHSLHTTVDADGCLHYRACPSRRICSVPLYCSELLAEEEARLPNLNVSLD